MIQIEVIHHDVTKLHGLLRLIVLAIHSVVDLNTQDLKGVTMVESIKNFDVNHHHPSISHPSWR